MTQNSDQFGLFLLVSIALHLLLIYFFVFGINFQHPLPEADRTIIFDVVPISEARNIMNQVKPIKEKTIIQEAKKAIQTPAPPLPPVESEKLPEKIQESKLIEPEPIKPLEKPIPKEIIEAPKKIETPKEKPKTAKESKPVVKEDKKIKKNDTKELDSLLKNLETSSDGNKSKSNKISQEQKIGPEGNNRSDNFNEELGPSMIDKDLIRQQIDKHWHPPIDAENIEQVKITVHIELSPDGEVNLAKVVERSCSAVSPSICKLMVDSALRALKAASPIKGLSPKNYNDWKAFNFNFQKIDDY